jgi:hypothetical protein
LRICLGGGVNFLSISDNSKQEKEEDKNLKNRPPGGFLCEPHAKFEKPYDNPFLEKSNPAERRKKNNAAISGHLVP